MGWARFHSRPILCGGCDGSTTAWTCPRHGAAFERYRGKTGGVEGGLIRRLYCVVTHESGVDCGQRTRIPVCTNRQGDASDGEHGVEEGVEHQDLLVLVHDVQRDILRNPLALGFLLGAKRQNSATMDDVARAQNSPINGQMTVLDPAGQARTGVLIEELSGDLIETLATAQGASTFSSTPSTAEVVAAAIASQNSVVW